MFTPRDDLSKIWKRISSDPIIISLLGITDDDINKAKHVLKRRVYDDLSEGEKRINVYFKPSRGTGSKIFFEEVIEVDCHVPAKLDHIALELQEQICKLLHEWEVNGRTIRFDSQLGELPAMPGFYCAGCRFCFNRIIRRKEG